MGFFAQLTGNAETLYEEGIQAARVKNYDKALRLLEKAARRGHVKAQRRCAWMYGAGRAGEKNPEKAFYWFEQAARQGDAEAQYQCARRCQTGRGTEKDPEAALQWLQKSAAQGYKEAQEALRGPEKEVSLTVNGQETTLAQLEQAARQGDADAQFTLGTLCLRGEEMDLSTALSWLGQARRSGHPQAEDAIYALTEIMGEKLYVRGLAAKDPAAALDCFQKAAGFGLARAQFDCGTLYEEGTAGAVDLEKALTFYEKAARKGHVPARMACARMYAHGEGTAAKPEKALYWYEKAAEKGEPRAQYVCAVQYKNGEGCPVDRKKALYWMERAAEQGDILSQYLCGLMYKNGEGTAVQEEKALSWLQKAAEQGHPEAKKEIGRLRRARHPAASPMEAARQAFQAEDYAEALRLAAPPAQAGELEAQMFLGKLYSLGLGTGRNPERAFACFQDAARQGDAEAQYLCAQMYRKGEGVPPDLEAACSWYEKAAEQGHAKAQYQCGLACRKGSGRPKDLKKALFWFQKAAEQGHAEARRSYEVLSETEKDPEKIFAYYRDTALDGDHDAQLRFALLCWERRDREAAFHWLETFAFQGESLEEAAREESRILYSQEQEMEKLTRIHALSAFAQYDADPRLGARSLLLIAQKGIAPAQFFYAKLCTHRLLEDSSECSQEEAFSWYEKAARQGHPKAQLSCGLLCRLGLGTPADKTAAKSWLEQAAGQTQRLQTQEAAKILLQELF